MTTRSIFITGGASGIGLATGRHFARAGWRVGLADRNAPALAPAAAAIGGPVAAFAMDVTDRAQWDGALAAFAPDGRLDVLFNNAGVAAGGPILAMDDAALDTLFAVNIRGLFHGARAAHPLLAATPGAVLVNTGSAASLYAAPGMSAYSATKFAVRALTESLDQEWAADGIAVRAILPSFIDTPLLDAAASGSNRAIRDVVRAQGLEFTPVEAVAETVWRAVHERAGGRIFWPVGKTARRLAFASRWTPGALLRRGRTAR